MPFDPLDWSYRKYITINKNKVVGGTHSNFPISVSLQDKNLLDHAKSDGSDIVFTDTDGETVLDFEIERWDNTTGELVAWIRIPSLSNSSNKTIWMYYGNASATDLSNPTGVWDSNFRAVYHLEGSYNATIGEVKDSTSNGFHGEASASDVPVQTPGKIGKGQNFDETTREEIVLDATNTMFPSTSIGATPTFVGAGTAVATAGSSLAPGYPSGLNEGDLLILQVGSTSPTSDNSVTTPANWTLKHALEGSSLDGKQAIYYRYVPAGGLAGTLTVTVTTPDATGAIYARIYAFRGIHQINPFEGGELQNGNGSTITSPSITTSDINRLCVAFTMVGSDTTMANFSGETGGNWTEPVAEAGNTTGDDGTLGLQTAELASAGTISGGTITVTTGGWTSRGFALIPADVSEITFETWFRLKDNTTPVNQRRVFISIGSTGSSLIVFATDSGANLFIGTHNGSGFNSGRVVDTITNLRTGWHYAVIKRTTTNTIVRLDGIEKVNIAEGFGIPGTSPIRISQDAADIAWHGDVDEFRLSSGIRSNDWLDTTYNNQINPLNFFSLGTQEKIVNPGEWDYRTKVTIDRTKIYGAIPIFIGAGAGTQTTGASFSVDYPTDIKEGDLLILQVGSTAPTNANTITTPTDWTQKHALEGSSLDGQQAIYYRYVPAGGLSGSLAVTVTTPDATGALYARMYAFRGTHHSSPFEGGALQNGNGTTVTAPSITTTDINRLCVVFTMIGSNTSQANFTGESGGDLTEAIAEYINTLGDDGSLGLQIAKLTSSGTLSGGTMTVTTGGWASRGFALVPAVNNIETHLNFPFLISITNTSLRDRAKSDGTDIIFVDTDGESILDFEIEKWDNTTGLLIAWVRIPEISGVTNKDIYIVYGNSSASDMSNPTGVWINRYRAVYHLNGSYNTTTNEIIDSTIFGFHGQSTNASNPTQVDAQIGKGQKLDEDLAGNIQLDATNSILQFSACYTLEIWFKQNDGTNPANNTQRNLIEFQRNSGSHSALITINPGNVFVWGSHNGIDFNAGQTITTVAGLGTVWNYIVLKRSATHTIARLNKSQLLNVAQILGDFGTGLALIGSTTSGFRADFHVDEYRISDTLRSDHWLDTTYDNHDDPNSFITLTPITVEHTTERICFVPSFDEYEDERDVVAPAWDEYNTERECFNSASGLEVTDERDAFNSAYTIETTERTGSDKAFDEYPNERDAVNEAYLGEFADERDAFNSAVEEIIDEREGSVKAFDEYPSERDAVDEAYSGEFTDEREGSVKAWDEFPDERDVIAPSFRKETIERVGYNSAIGEEPTERPGSVKAWGEYPDERDAFTSSFITESDEILAFNSAVINVLQWTYKKPIVIHKEQIVGSHIDFPVTIILTDEDLSNNANINGYDIVFTDNDEFTVLDYQIEYWDKDEGKLVAHIKIPVLSDEQDKNIWMYYGNPDSFDLSKPEQVWTNNFRAVYHLNGIYDGTEEEVIDSTINHFHGNGFELSSPTQVDAKIGKGQSFETDDNESLELAPSNEIFITNQDFTLELWFRQDNIDLPVNQRRILTWIENFGNPLILLNTDNSGFLTIATDNGGLPNVTRNIDNIISLGVGWHYIVIKRTATNTVIRLDKVEKINAIESIGNFGDDPGTISYNGDDLGWDGEIDEYRISDIIRTDDWLDTTYNNQNNPSSFYLVFPQILNSVPTERIASAPSYQIHTDDRDVSISSHITTADWTYKKKITIDKLQVFGSNFDFPILINITDPDLSNHAKEDGGDIIFTDTDGTTFLEFEIEYWDNITGELVAHVQVPELNDVDDKIIWIFYGNPNIFNFNNPNNTWDEYFSGIYHLNDIYNGTNEEVTDSTSFHRHGKAHSFSESPDQIDSIIGKGQSFLRDDKDEIDLYSTEIYFTNNENFTVEMWFRLTDLSNPGVGNSRRLYQILGEGGLILLWIGQTGTNLVITTHTGGSQNPERIIDSSINLDIDWHYIAIRRTETNTIVRLDGVEIFDETEEFGEFGDGIITLSTNEITQTFEGEEDELRLSDIYRSDDWLDTTYSNQSDPNAFYIFDIETLNSVSTERKGSLEVYDIYPSEHTGFDTSFDEYTNERDAFNSAVEEFIDEREGSISAFDEYITERISLNNAYLGQFEDEIDAITKSVQEFKSNIKVIFHDIEYHESDKDIIYNSIEKLQDERKVSWVLYPPLSAHPFMMKIEKKRDWDTEIRLRKPTTELFDIVINIAPPTMILNDVIINTFIDFDGGEFANLRKGDTNTDVLIFKKRLSSNLVDIVASGKSMEYLTEYKDITGTPFAKADEVKLLSDETRKNIPLTKKYLLIKKITPTTIFGKSNIEYFMVKRKSIQEFRTAIVAENSSLLDDMRFLLPDGSILLFNSVYEEILSENLFIDLWDENNIATNHRPLLLDSTKESLYKAKWITLYRGSLSVPLIDIVK